MSISLHHLYESYDTQHDVQNDKTNTNDQEDQSLMDFYRTDKPATNVNSNGFTRMANVRKALQVIDQNGWERSYHQKQFHDVFLRACARVFWKTEPQGQFARDHQKILQLNGWDHLSQEILISTPRRSAL